MSIAIISYNFILFGLFGWISKIYLYPLFFLIFIDNQLVFTIKQLAADAILFSIAYIAKSLTGKWKSDLKTNLNGHSSICRLIEIWISLKKVCFHGKGQDHFTHKSVSLFIIWINLSEWKIESILLYLVRNFKSMQGTN